ncbi:MAG TPA: pirin family protein [Phycisphaerales bacterium]|nr:pirin family protein [Phycisphaerales bacterium]
MNQTIQTPSKSAFEITRASDRGATEIGWLHGRHSFSFGRYFNPQRMNFRALRVLNDDIVEPAAGFGEHGHDNMEIITWVLDGELAHRDSTGNAGVIRPGDAQVMSAGTGIHHSEMNPSQTDRVHLLQIWLQPDVRGLQPAYAQKSFPVEGRANRWQLIASPDARAGSLTIHQDATLSITNLTKDAQLAAVIPQSRFGYLHVAFGEVVVNGETLRSGDAISFSGPVNHGINATADSQLLLFDLA